MNYGLPYKGSKSRICPWLMEILPQCDTFVDVFCGGCAVTHAAMLANKAERFIINDINWQMPRLFLDAIRGKYHNETRWISREDFFRLKYTDAFVADCWSFGNGCNSYLYSRKIEPYKCACHCAVVFDEWEFLEQLCPEVVDDARAAIDGVIDRKERRLKFGPAIVKKLKTLTNDNPAHPVITTNPLYKTVKVKERLQSLQSLQGLESLESLARLESLESLARLERLQSLESLQSLERLKVLSMDYRQLVIPEGAVVYCDPPYKNTEAYGGKGFDHKAFYVWCVETAKRARVYVSEYQIDDARFELVGEKRKLCSMSSTKSSNVTERLYTVRGAIS